MRTVTLLALLAACSSSKGDVNAAGSSTVAAVGRSIYTVNAWDGTLSWVEWDAGTEERIQIDGEPTRVAVVGEDQLWVTLRADRSVAVFDRIDDAPVEATRFELGAEPYGIVANADGSRVYVALSQEDVVVELDGATQDELRRFSVMDDPRWLALHPSERALFVASTYDSRLARIDLETGEITYVDAPATTRPTEDGETVDLTPRPTGDPSINGFGDALVLPGLYVDNTTPVEQPDETGEPPQEGGGYASSPDTSSQLLSIGRMNPALIGVALDPKDGSVLQKDPVLAFFVGGVDRRGNVARGYIASATFAPNGTTVYASLESADQVAVVDLRPEVVDGDDDHSLFDGDDDVMLMSDTSTGSGVFVQPRLGRFTERPQEFIETDGNPAGVAFDRDGFAWVDERGARATSWIDAERLQEGLDGELQLGAGAKSIGGRHQLGEPLLDPSVEAGRDLFYSATDGRMAAEGAGVSCSTCHTDGRNDGLTWTFDDGIRQTPSLAGQVALTEPVTWTRDVASVAQEAQITSKGRMGGRGLGNADAADVESFVNWTRDVDVERKGERSDQILLGQKLFERSDVGCATCHSGAKFTDNQAHDVFGLVGVNTPGLVGVDATAPYLHDGSYPTLRSLLERVRDGSMGDTAALNDLEMDALEAYLRSL